MTDAEHGQVSATAAQVYEDLFVPALFDQFVEALLDVACVGEGTSLLDVGCGTGVVARGAARRVGDAGAVVGVDPNPGMLAVARRESSQVDWWEGVAERLPFGDDTFDVVTCQFALMFFADREAAVAEMARVTRPGGRIAVAVWSRVEESPGYALMVDLLDRLFGADAAAAMRSPFTLGDPGVLRGLLAASLDDVAVRRVDGVARFASVNEWVETDVRGWTLAEMIDDHDEERLLRAVEAEMTHLVADDGSVRFPAPALVATARSRPG